MAEGFKVQHKKQHKEQGKVYLYNAGDEYTTLTGGWTLKTLTGISGSYSLTKEASSLKINGKVSATACMIYPINKIDISIYTKLCATIRVTQKTNSYYSPTIGAWNIIPSLRSDYLTDAVAYTGHILATTIATYDYVLDISNVNGIYYLPVGFNTGWSGTYTFYIDKVWLE